MYSSATSLTIGYRRRNCMAVRVVESTNLQASPHQHGLRLSKHLVPATAAMPSLAVRLDRDTAVQWHTLQRL